MLSLLRSSAALLLIAVVFVISTPFAFAQGDACACFCGDPDFGAEKLSASFSSPTSCAISCEDKNDIYVGCYTDEEQYPENNDKCWTKAECEAWTKEIDDVVYKGEWGKQNSYCSITKSGSEMGYCYGPLRRANLNVTILGETSVSGIPEYINLAYRFLLPAMSLVAVVMLMIGGLEYVISAGNAKRIDRAKDRMKNAMIGVVLLLSAYAIANFIDPRLVKFDQLRIPLLKEVTLLDPSSSCEALNDVGYDISPSRGFCGEEGEIDSTDGVRDNVASGSWEKGDTCNFMRCADDGDACMSDGECVYCAKIENPGASTCAAAERLTGSSNDTQHYCRYDATLNSCVTLVRDVTDISDDVKARGIYCPTLRSDAKSSGLGCLEYGQRLQIAYSEGADDLSETSKGKSLLEIICEDDPCGLAKEIGALGCSYNYLGGEYSGSCDNIYAGGSSPSSSSGFGTSPTP